MSIFRNLSGIKLQFVSTFLLLNTVVNAAISTAPKDGFHVRNKHRNRYDFKFLKSGNPDLIGYVKHNKYGDESIEFSNPLAVTALNKALLSSYYNVKDWKVPADYLCPPIPSRADYVHHISDLISSSSGGDYDSSQGRGAGRNIRCLDIGTGANAIYPLIGFAEYGWSFVGTDVDKLAIDSAKQIITSNKEYMTDSIQFRLQNEPTDIFLGVVRPGDKFEACFCNPPFHATLEECRTSSNRKWTGLGKGKTEIVKKVPTLNFGGQGTELVYAHGGEMGFLRKMIRQSAHDSIRVNVMWFTTLISKNSNLDETYRLLEEAKGLVEHKTVEMQHGQKKSRIVAWTFMESNERAQWFRE
mmetsp:Transcript_28023/g.26878  ORF Transcript_28023/g.26878 Transcript_28023/m.26878 type:complete len:356 (-) Transcript_28023:207-1274(-)